MKRRYEKQGIGVKKGDKEKKKIYEKKKKKESEENGKRKFFPLRKEKGE